MKKLLLILAVALSPYLAVAQTDTLKTRIFSKATEEYASIMPRSKFLSDNITLLVEGMPGAYTNDKELLDENRKPMVFAHIVEALNYMARLGWMYVNTYTDGKGLHYLLRRPVDNNASR